MQIHGHVLFSSMVDLVPRPADRPQTLTSSFLSSACVSSRRIFVFNICLFCFGASGKSRNHSERALSLHNASPLLLLLCQERIIEVFNGPLPRSRLWSTYRESWIPRTSTSSTKRSSRFSPPSFALILLCPPPLTRMFLRPLSAVALSLTLFLCLFVSFVLFVLSIDPSRQFVR